MSRLMMRVGVEVSVVRTKREAPSRSGLLLMAVLLAVSVFPTGAFAQNDDWLGGTGNWSNPSKWSAGVPTASSNVFIDHGKAGASPSRPGHKWLSH